jgi:predicted naringenin-chalcone synthase
VNHNGFVSSENIIKAARKTVGENIHNYRFSQSAINAWLNSPGHKKNIVEILLILVFQYEKILKQAKILHQHICENITLVVVLN